MRISDGGGKGPLDRLRASLAPTTRQFEDVAHQEKVRTIHYGIGAIGAEIVRTIANSLEIEIVGAIDANPAKAGKDLGEAAGVGYTMGIPVSYEADPVLRDIYADVVVHCTGSSLTEVLPQLLAIVSSEKSVVSSCEELSFPWTRYSEVAQKLDRKAREAGVRVLGTGVNPGFVMDFLPLVIATASQQVKSIRVDRIVDIATRRIQLQRKTGAGLSVKGFREGAGAGSIGHVGLRESALMIADTFGWKLDDLAETLEPVVAQDKRKTEFLSVERGYVLGLRQSAVGLISDQEVIRLDLEMSLGAKNPHDAIEIEGRPPIRLTIPGGIPGDIATASIIANCVPAIARSRSVGLLSMRDLPLIPYFRPRASPQRESIE